MVKCFILLVQCRLQDRSIVYRTGCLKKLQVLMTNLKVCGFQTHSKSIDIWWYTELLNTFKASKLYKFSKLSMLPKQHLVEAFWCLVLSCSVLSRVVWSVKRLVTGDGCYWHCQGSNPVRLPIAVGSCTHCKALLIGTTHTSSCKYIESAFIYILQ